MVNGVLSPPRFEIKTQVYTFRCPMCRKVVRYDSDMEPLCTGPNEGTDDHDLIIMDRISVTEKGRDVRFMAA